MITLLIHTIINRPIRDMWIVVYNAEVIAEVMTASYIVFNGGI